MKKIDVFKNLALIGLGFVPNGDKAVSAIKALTHKDDDPTNDAEEIADHIADVVIEASLAAEGLAGKDYINQAAILALKANIASSIRLIPHVVNRPASPLA
tara:strand:+ start:574 stop:876 length:303 start_codon:yes stop_codon:yes gene_type:complete